ncbi:MipA/OmpV family protein [Moraxella sp. FZLJ2107]|uniref:MipA/OmpV family protein n=1 Tax=unclassified Moraxella TaxID=2685852 RepID=UPI0020C8EA6A|nr:MULTISPECIES: MipA/OmpV family protein [unclassified Moraxella]UTO05379.1 MipA/OmpV family protein [Moraxella sp. FZLJ2107]UTO22114.1 MipA/OmpV family protein [Moraxella sp. FZLJ2109]
MKTNFRRMQPVMALALLPLVSVNPDGQLPVDPNARLTIGANATYNVSGYATDDDFSFMPQAFYDNNRVYVEGAEAGFYPYKDANDHVRVGISYDGREFDPSDALDVAQRELDKRKWSALAHASYMHITPYGGLRVKATTDALGRHDGQTVTLSHLSKFNFADNKVTVYPEFGAVWQSKDYNQYYYSVSAAESARTGVDAFQAKSGWMPFATVTASYQLTDHVSIFGNQRVEWLSSTQKDSPLTDDDIDSKTRVGVNYKF